MLSITKIKRRFLRRQWFNKTQIFEDGTVHRARRHGLRYGDVRSHQGVKLSHVGQKELLIAPYDEMAEYRKHCKYRTKIADQELNREVRKLRRSRQNPLVGVSFKHDRRDFYHNLQHEFWEGLKVNGTPMLSETIFPVVVIEGQQEDTMYKMISELVPVVTDVNKDHFLETYPADCLPMGLTSPGSFWDGVTTGVLKVNMPHNLITLSQNEDMLADGVLKTTDNIRNELFVVRLVMAKEGEPNRYIDVSDLADNGFFGKGDDGDQWELQLRVPGSRLGSLFTWVVLPGEVNLKTGELLIKASDAVNDEGWKIAGFVLKGWRVNKES